MMCRSKTRAAKETVGGGGKPRVTDYLLLRSLQWDLLAECGGEGARERYIVGGGMGEFGQVCP